LPELGAPAPDQPQQSLSTWQSSPTGWQPDGFWHTEKPGAAPVEPHLSEQQALSHCPPAPQPVVTVPATRQPATPEMLIGPQMPSRFEPVLLHWPVQQSAFVKQVSFCWRQ
jgi:hypothetical protein